MIDQRFYMSGAADFLTKAISDLETARSENQDPILNSVLEALIAQRSILRELVIRKGKGR